MDRWWELAVKVPARLHVVTFGGNRHLWGVTAFCEGCGWSMSANSASNSDRVYWAAREHLAKVQSAGHGVE